ncbi:cysteine synthase A [Streptococcus sp. CSL10205-OR2]|uniref:cysteine synthase A n=1 Tax=Streptococcus sp. CSL10205-OR2 TaxID=2980558 RepID=UPI0021DADADA|nr:cysteine synthase A [Streptococcus sp. CSL10205-OR2]MCU9533500.1 cysteine synthase A [Streptococcus sp. CSL10205-OR2]
MTKLYNNITELVGNTPIVKLNKLVPEGAADVYVKLESFNPGSSVKDRIALGMINQAEKDGLLKEGDTIVEATSGNTGIGIAFVGAAKGYHVIIVMPDSMSVERQKLIKAYGAELVLTPGSDGMPGAIQKAKEIIEEKNAVALSQFNNPANPAAHENTTGPEIIASFEDIGLDAFVSGVGTGGTISGVSHALKKWQPNIAIYAVEAKESAVLSGEPKGKHGIQGISAGFIPDTLDTKSYDGIVTVSTDEALQTSRNAAQKEGLLVGISAGAALFASIEVAKKLGEGKKVLAILPDTGERYLSTSLFQ